jgi:hypothetical protein
VRIIIFASYDISEYPTASSLQSLLAPCRAGLGGLQNKCFCYLAGYGQVTWLLQGSWQAYAQTTFRPGLL